MGWFEDLFIEEAKPALEKYSGNGSTRYDLPIATETVLGGVKPVVATEAMTQPVGVDSEGRLFADKDPDVNQIKDDISALQGIANDDHINGLINTALGVIENGSY